MGIIMTFIIAATLFIYPLMKMSSKCSRWEEEREREDEKRSNR